MSTILHFFPVYLLFILKKVNWNLTIAVKAIINSVLFPQRMLLARANRETFPRFARRLKGTAKGKREIPVLVFKQRM